MKKNRKKRVHCFDTQMTELAPIPAPGTIERIRRAQSPDQVAELVAHAVGFKLANDATLRRINRAAVKRNKELSRP